MNRRDLVRQRIEDASSGINDSTCWDDPEWNDEIGKSIMDRLVEDIDRIYGVLPDDGEMATYEWCKTLGLESFGEALAWSFHCRDVWIHGIFGHPEDTFMKAGRNVVKNPTRYQFRRLCEVLGVEVKEGKGE